MMRFFTVGILVVLACAVAAQAGFIVESRSGGNNYANYTDAGFANSSGNVTAPGCIATGSRYSGTTVYFGPTRYAQYSFTPTESGSYQIDLAWTVTAGQTDTAVNVYTGAAVGSSTDAWGNTNAPDGIIASAQVDMYYKNSNVWNTIFASIPMTAGTTYKVGIYGGHQSTDGLTNRVASGAAQFTLVPEPATLAFLAMGALAFLRRRSA